MRFECPVCKKLVSFKEGELGIEVICPHCSHSVKVPSSKLSNGFVVADFIIRDEIGHGGMGVVYAAHQISLDRPSAVKVLNQKYAKDFEFVASFVKEARAAARLNHPNIVQAYAVGADNDIFYFAMEFVDGETMKQILKREKIIPIDKAMTIIQEITEALNYGWHEQKMIHCDIKPDNIMITSKGVAKLADLGLARKAEDSQGDDDDEVLGTPQYISPEQLTGDKLDIRTDIFSLGATLYQFVTARLPFEGNSLNEIARKRLTHDPIPPNKINQDIPDAVNQIIMKMLQRNPNDRYQGCEELLKDLKKLQSGNVPTQEGRKAKAKGKQFSVRRRETPTEHPTMTSPTVPVTGTMSLDKKNIIKEGKNVILIAAGGFMLLILIVVAIWLTMFSGDQSATPVKPMPVTTKTTIGSANKSIKSIKSVAGKSRRVIKASMILKFKFEIQKMLSEYRNHKVSKDNFMANVDQLMVKYPEIPDVQAFNSLMDVYVPLDEVRIDRERTRLYQQHQRQIEKLKRIAEQKKAEQQRLAEIARKQQEQAEKERRLCEALEKKEREEKLKKLRELYKYKATISKQKDELRFKFADLCTKHQFKQLYNLLEAAKNTGEAVKYASQDKIAVANKFVHWLSSLQDSLKQSEAVYNLFNNSGKTLALKQIEKNYKLYTILSINDGIATVNKPSSDEVGTKTVKLKLESLGRPFWVFFNKIVKKRHIQDARFYYYLANGYFQYHMVPPNSFWTEELSQLKYQYFKHKYATASVAEKKQMQKMYGKLYSFKQATSQ